MNALTIDRNKGKAITYYVLIPGLNYSIDEMIVALGLVQLEKLEFANNKRKELIEKYIENLKDCKKITIPFQKLNNIKSVYHIASTTY